MNKYNPDQLQQMAQIVLADDQQQGERSFVLYMKLSALTGLTPTEVRERIIAYAEGGFIDESV